MVEFTQISLRNFFAYFFFKSIHEESVFYQSFAVPQAALRRRRCHQDSIYALALVEEARCVERSILDPHGTFALRYRGK